MKREGDDCMKYELKKDLEKAKRKHSKPEDKKSGWFEEQIARREGLYEEILQSDIYPEYKRLRDELLHGEAEALLRGKDDLWRVCCNNCYRYQQLLKKEKEELDK
jgi:hypothetical protein